MTPTRFTQALAIALARCNDAREELLRAVILTERLAAMPAPQLGRPGRRHLLSSPCGPGHSEHAAKEISYHATSGTKDIVPGSLIAQCTGRMVGVDAMGRHRAGWGCCTWRIRSSMLLNAEGGTHVDGSVCTRPPGRFCSMCTRTRMRGWFRSRSHESVIRTFPGPAHGPEGIRAATGIRRAPDVWQPS
jgi:hypothetical protein